MQLFCDPMDCSPPGSSVDGISQTRILGWVSISFSRRSSQPRNQTHVSSALTGEFLTTESLLLLQLSRFSRVRLLCDPIDGSPPGSPVSGILQARTLEWAAISFSNAWKWKRKVKLLSPIRLFATPWTAAWKAPPCMGFSRQEYWSGFPFPSPGDLPNSGIEPESPTSQADAFTVWATREIRS